jgi:hypothetical protein
MSISTIFQGKVLRLYEIVDQLDKSHLHSKLLNTKLKGSLANHSLQNIKKNGW